MFPGIPIFAISGQSENPVLQNPNIYGFTDSISKPFKKYQLAEQLNKYLN
jgi:hypothetical protein